MSEKPNMNDERVNCFRSIVEDASDCVFVAERKTRRVLYINKSIGRLFGLPESILNQRMEKHENISSRFVFLTQEQVDQLTPDEHHIFHVVFENRLYLEIKARALDWNGIDAYVMFFHDETSEVEYQAKMAEMIAEMAKTQEELQRNRARLQEALESVQVMEWRYDYAKKEAIDMGSFGTLYNRPSQIQNMEEALKRLEREQWIHPDSAADMWWLFEHCGDGKRIYRDLRYRTPDKSRYIWLRVIFKPTPSQTEGDTIVTGVAMDITEQKERELAYEEQLRLKKAAARGDLAMATYNVSKNMITEAETSNPELMKLLQNGTADDILHRVRYNASSPEEQERFLVMKDCATLLKEYREGTSHIEIRHHIKNDRRWMLTSVDMLTNPYTSDVEAITTLRDISDVVRAELVVQRLLAVEYDAIMTISAKTGEAHPFRTGSIEPTVELTKLPESLRNMVGEEEIKIVTEHLKKNPMYETLYSVVEDGAQRHKRAMYTYLEENNDIILMAIQDVTETFEQEESQKDALSRALHEAEEASSFKTNFLSRMSHDMRTPMNGILGLTQLSEQETDVTVLKNNMTQISESGHYLLSLINDTLDFQRIESGKMSLNKQVVYAPELFQGLLDMIRPLAEAKHIDFQVCGHGIAMDWYIQVDPVRIKQIFVNLLSNAIKFTPEGGTVILDIESISREGMMSSVCIRVKDSGIGMSQEFINRRLFHPFEQEQKEVTSQYTGSGLGLSIVQSLVEMMGGRIEVESQLGKGTTFAVYIDFQRMEDWSEHEKKKGVQDFCANFAEVLGGTKILLVEDHPLNAKIACKMLERVGCETVWVDDGKKGLDTFAASASGEYDAILMDIRMPIMNGLISAKSMRKLAREDAATIPIIAMTANAYTEDIQTSFMAGMNAHLAKPVDAVKLYEELIHQIEKRRKSEKNS